MIVSLKSFSAGELTPSLHTRSDLVKYATGLKTCRNFSVLRHGGVSNRPGTEFVGEGLGDANRLIKFVFNNSQTYILDFSDQKIRFIQNGAYLTDLVLTITNIANPATDVYVVTYTGTDPSNFDSVTLSGIGGALGPFLNGRTFQIGSVNPIANTFELVGSFNGAAYPVYSSGGVATRLYSISTPYLEADLPLLKYVQSADVITIVHPSYAPRELARLAATNWTLTALTFAPSLSAPTGVAVSGAAGTVVYWVVTAVKTDTYEESVASTQVGASAVPTSGAPRTLTWNVVADAVEYNIYRSVNGVFGFVGVAVGLSFQDVGYDIDTTDTPPVARNPFSTTDLYPSTVTYIQQRLGFANSNDFPEKVWLSRTGFFKNFTISSPIQADDAVTFTMAGRQVNAVKHLIDVGQLVVFTTAGEWSVGGDASGVIRPTDINPKQQSYDGANDLIPIVISGNALYVQAEGSIVRDLGFDYQIDGYRGNDLSIFSNHLFEGHSLVSWDYQKTPNSTLWAIRDDGTMLGLTYVREQQVLGWHRHDTDGTFLDVCCVPENGKTAVYVVVQRDGGRFVERLTDRFIEDIKDAVFVDSSLSYDGRNSSVNGALDYLFPLRITGGVTWASGETLTLTCSSSLFLSTDVGNQYQINGPSGEYVVFTITAFASATSVSGTASINVPTSMRYDGVTYTFETYDWTKAVDVVSGLWHIEGKSVSVLADGFVVANPNNDQYTALTVTNGSLTLDNPYGVIHVGLPYTSDLETLDIDSADSETMLNKKKKISKVRVQLENSRGLFVGGSEPSSDSSFDDLYELKIRDAEGYDDPVDLLTGSAEVILKAEWNSNGRVFIRQTDALPLTILSIAPEGDIPGGR